MERLYCPDFTSIFSSQFADPFRLSTIDAQIWPIFEEERYPKQLSAFLALKSHGYPVFHRRKITIDQLQLELDISQIQSIFFQGLELGTDFGIPNEYTIKIASKMEGARVLCSIDPKKEGLARLQELWDKYKDIIAGFVLYPNYQRDFLDSIEFQYIFEWFNKIRIPIKIDFTNLHLSFLPLISSNKIEDSLCNVFSKLKDNLSVILSCGDWNSLIHCIDYYKYQPNIYLDLNLRMLGGQTPTNYFTQLFQLPGFIQNWWSRLLLSSGSPTMETSQLVRGWVEATESLEMKFRHLLRIWGFRNANRVFFIKPLKKPNSSKIVYQLASEFTNSSVIHLGYDILVQSSAITQLISIQSVFDEIITEVLKSHPETQSGTITVKSDHTTVSLIINENEIGNFLDLHYHFVKESMVDSQRNFHTVAAMEKRADFNFQDHLLTSKYGQRVITYHLRNGSISKGSREHLYVLATFGPRQMRIGLDVILFKN